MNFSWNDQSKIHPVWPDGVRRYPTLAITASQKNGRVQEIPMLPGLRELLDSVEETDRHGWVVNPQSVEFQRDHGREWVRPTVGDLQHLLQNYSNLAIAQACGVSEASIRKWCRNLEIDSGHRGRQQEVPRAVVEEIWSRGLRQGRTPSRAGSGRLSVERVGRLISRIGEEARIVVRVDEDGKPVKYASAHDIRRGCAQRLINDGVSAETLKLVLRHSDFATTEKFYGAIRSAQAAAKEIHQLEKRGKEARQFQ
jgi:integrase